ncbi:MAG TPA: hypothetical protein VH327_02120 [Gammaproteobacteria bacterium]|jgi:hypothetical protein|nr:hypothetical protein [Gammaproteobacteria bacterium]
MQKRPALLGLCLLLSWKAAFATPVFPLPALTAAPPQVATSVPPAAASKTAPPAAATSTQAPPAAAPPKPPPPNGPRYSYVQAALFLAQPYGKEDVGHGEELDVSYALTPQAFLVGEFDRTSHTAFATRRYDVGLGLDTVGTWGHSYFMELLWTGASTDPISLPGSAAHGWAVETGVRVVPVQDVELYAWVRHDENDDFPGHTSGRAGFFYHLFHTQWILGVSIGADAEENTYLLSLKWSY